MTAYDEERLAKLIRALPPAPVVWVRAAQELPFARGELDEIVARAEADAAFRQRLIADLEGARAAPGDQRGPAGLAARRARFTSA